MAKELDIKITRNRMDIHPSGIFGTPVTDTEVVYDMEGRYSCDTKKGRVEILFSPSETKLQDSVKDLLHTHVDRDRYTISIENNVYMPNTVFRGLSYEDRSTLSFEVADLL